MSRERFDDLIYESGPFMMDPEHRLALACAAWAATDNGVAPDLLVPLASAGRAIIWC